MLRIRLTRTGRKNLPHYRIVVAEHSAPVKGKFIAILGSYDPLKKKVQLEKEEALNWMKKGAKPSNTVAKIFTKEGIKHKSIVIVKFHKKPKTQEKAAAEKPVQEQTANKPEVKAEAAEPKPEKEAPAPQKTEKTETKPEVKAEVKTEEK